MTGWLVYQKIYKIFQIFLHIMRHMYETLNMDKNN